MNKSGRHKKKEKEEAEAIKKKKKTKKTGKDGKKLYSKFASNWADAKRENRRQRTSV